MIVNNQYNQIAADRQNVWTPQGGGSKNISVQSECKDKSAVNITADRYIELTHLLG